MTNMTKMNQQTGLLESAQYHPSPHQDARPLDVEINMIVVHGISLPPGEFGTDAVSQFFCGKLQTDSHPYFQTIAHMRVSAHLLVQRSGDIIQFVPFSQRAWHAGESFFQGKTHCNDFSIGIELEGTDDLPYEDIQYRQLAEIIRVLRLNYPAITLDRIVGHVDIAPGRKTDPGSAFNWNYLRGLNL